MMLNASKAAEVPVTDEESQFDDSTYLRAAWVLQLTEPRARWERRRPEDPQQELRTINTAATTECTQRPERRLGFPCVELARSWGKVCAVVVSERRDGQSSRK